MIDADNMKTRHITGLQQIETLQAQEKLALQLYCQMLAKHSVDEGNSRGAPVLDSMINAVRHGIAMGLNIRISQGEVLGRQ